MGSKTLVERFKIACFEEIREAYDYKEHEIVDVYGFFDIVGEIINSVERLEKVETGDD